MTDPHKAIEMLATMIEAIDGASIRTNPATGRKITKSVNGLGQHSAYMTVDGRSAGGRKFRWDVRVSDHPSKTATISVSPNNLNDAADHISALLG